MSRYREILVSMLDAVLKKIQLRHNINELREIDDDTVDDDVSCRDQDTFWFRTGHNSGHTLSLHRMRLSGRASCDRAWSTWQRWRSCSLSTPSVSWCLSWSPTPVCISVLLTSSLALENVSSPLLTQLLSC